MAEKSTQRKLDWSEQFTWSAAVVDESQHGRRRSVTELSILEMTAEVSVAFAGFIGVFLILATREGRFGAEDSLAIQALVIGSVASVFYSAAPLILYAFGVSGAELWRISSGLIGLVGVAVVAYVVPQVRALALTERTRSVNLSNLVGLTLSALGLLCLLANVLAWPWAPSGGMYLLAVWLVVAIAGFNFVVLIFRKVL